MSISIYVKSGMVVDVSLPDDVKEYLIRDYDIPEEEQDFLNIPESDYPKLVIDVKGGFVADVWNKTDYEYEIIDEDV